MLQFTSVIIGLVCMLLTFMIGHLGTIFEISIKLRSAYEGPLVGLFIMGLIFPWIGRRGALTGVTVALVVMHWLVIGNQWNVFTGRIKDSSLPTSTENCKFSLTLNVSASEEFCGNLSTKGKKLEEDDDDVFFLFRISMLHFHLIGALITILTGAATSFYTKETDISKMNPNLITPMMHRWNDMTI